MNEIKATATAYAADRMRGNHGDVFTREDLFYAIRDAYEQGWVDCDTKGMKPESANKFFDEAPDCEYYAMGKCTKSLNSICMLNGCVAYCPNVKKGEMTESKPRNNDNPTDNTRSL